MLELGQAAVFTWEMYEDFKEQSIFVSGDGLAVLAVKYGILTTAKFGHCIFFYLASFSLIEHFWNFV